MDQACFHCHTENSLTWFPARQGSAGWYYCHACGRAGDMVDLINTQYGKTLRCDSHTLKRHLPDLHCPVLDYRAAVLAYRQKHATRSVVSPAAKYWALRMYREDTDKFFELNNRKMRAKHFTKMLHLFKDIAYVGRQEWSEIFGQDVMPRAVAAGHPMQQRKDPKRRLSVVQAGFDSLAREWAGTFYIRLEGRPGETVGCLFLQKHPDKYEVRISWSCDTVRRGIAFGKNLCHPHNVMRQRRGDPILITTDVVSALQLQTFYWRQLCVPPLMVLLPPKYLKFKEGVVTDLLRFPFFGKSIVVHTNDAASSQRLAVNFGARAVHTPRAAIAANTGFFEQFPEAMLRTMRTGVPPHASLPHR